MGEPAGGVNGGEGCYWQQQPGTCKGLAERESRDPWKWQAVLHGWGWNVRVEWGVGRWRNMGRGPPGSDHRG